MALGLARFSEDTPTRSAQSTTVLERRRHVAEAGCNRAGEDHVGATLRSDEAVGGPPIERRRRMPKGYVILTEVIRDPDGMLAYSRAAGPSITESGAKVLVVDRQPDVLEGEWTATQTVVLEFASVEAARNWYRSDTYQAAAKIRQDAADSNVVIVSGFEAAPA